MVGIYEPFTYFNGKNEMENFDIHLKNFSSIPTYDKATVIGTSGAILTSII